MDARDTERFWSKVEKSDGCWLWTASTFRSGGYGAFSIRHRMHRAHRVAWALANGPIPHGAVLCHRCDNPRCVNPAHLFVGSLADNNADMRAKGRQARGRLVPQAKLTPTQVAQIRAAYARGDVSQRVLAERYGVVDATICRIVTGAGWRHVDGARTRLGAACGERAPTSKLTRAQANEIRRLCAARDESHRAIAARYGVHVNTVRAIHYGTTWNSDMRAGGAP